MASPHILVVGGTKGIGRAVARTLTRDGTRVSVLGRSRPSGDVSYRAWTVDVSDTVALSFAKFKKIYKLQSKQGTADSNVDWGFSINEHKEV